MRLSTKLLVATVAVTLAFAAAVSIDLARQTPAITPIPTDAYTACSAPSGSWEADVNGRMYVCTDDGPVWVAS